MHKSEIFICQINFYHYKQRLVEEMGGYSDEFVDKNGGRRETFEIAEDEQLIGCELDYV